MGHAALAITRISHTQNHCAIVFRSDDVGGVKLAHLARNMRLGNPAPEPRYYFVEFQIHPSLQKFVAAICGKIVQAQPPVPYGLDGAGIAFDEKTGMILAAPVGKGMTCATFVLGILEHFGIHLLVKEEWPESANLQWQQIVLEQLENEAPKEHLQAMKADLGCRRFTPEEVVSCSAADEIPVGFIAAQTKAAELLSKLP